MEVDQIYHLACPASPVHYQRNPVRPFAPAVGGTSTCWTSPAECGARILIASTSEVYGDPAMHPQRESTGETSTPSDRDPVRRGQTMRPEALAVSYANQYNVEVRIARILIRTAGVSAREMGAWSRTSLFSSAWARAHGVWDGQQTPFLLLRDRLDRGISCVSWPVSMRWEPVNLGNPRETPCSSWPEARACLARFTQRIVFEPLPKDDPIRRMPISPRSSAARWLGSLAYPRGRGSGNVVATSRPALGA